MLDGGYRQSECVKPPVKREKAEKEEGEEGGRKPALNFPQ